MKSSRKERMVNLSMTILSVLIVASIIVYFAKETKSEAVHNEEVTVVVAEHPKKDVSELTKPIPKVEKEKEIIKASVIKTEQSDNNKSEPSQPEPTPEKKAPPKEPEPVVTDTTVVALSEVTGMKQTTVQFILNEADKNGIPHHVAFGMYDIETGGKFDPKLVNPSSGATGLGQIMPKTGQWLAGKMGVDYTYNSLKKPKYNIRMSLYYLGYLYDEFGTWHKALSAYNQGPGNVRSTGKTSSNYSHIALNRAEKYR